MSGSLPTKTNNPECQIVVFDWKYDGRYEDIEGLSNPLLAETVTHDISNYIKEVNYSKGMSNPAGSFEIVLENDRDWKQYLKKGSWLIIYKSNDGGLSIPTPGQREVILSNGLKGDAANVASLVTQKNKIRCIGYIDTVRANGSIGDERGDLDITYSVQGRDFGVVYEETEIWHNRVNFDESLLKTAVSQINANSIKTVDKLLTTLHNLIYSPERLIGKDLKQDSLTSIALQWLLPSKLFVALGMTPIGDSYFGNIPSLLNFSESPASYPVESPVALMNGIAWDRLKQYSLEPFHELFPELNDDGLPRLNFRPIPWKISDGSLFPKVARYITAFKDIPKVYITSLDITDFDLGEDNHTRYNLFWSTLNSSLVGVQTSLQMTGNNNPKTGFPRVNQESIKRHGLRLMYSEVNANITLGSEKADPDLVRQYNEVQLEYWQDSHLLESGTIDIVGNNEIRLGKLLYISDFAPYIGDKYFYIEGYSESFIVDEEGSSDWTQSLVVTRGIERSNLENGELTNNRVVSFRDKGDFTGR